MYGSGAVLSDAMPMRRRAGGRVGSVETTMTFKLSKLKTTLTIVCGMYAAARASGHSLPARRATRHSRPCLTQPRKDLRTEKQALIDQAMALDAGDKAKFWTIYQSFQKELDPDLGRTPRQRQEIRGELSVDDRRRGRSTRCVGADNEQQLTALKKKYHAQFKAALGARPLRAGCRQRPLSEPWRCSSCCRRCRSCDSGPHIDSREAQQAHA